MDTKVKQQYMELVNAQAEILAEISANIPKALKCLPINSFEYKTYQYIAKLEKVHRLMWTLLLTGKI